MYTITKPSIDDIDEIMSLIDSRIKWMDEVGINQWNKTHYFERYPKEYFINNIDYFYIAKKENKIVGFLAAYLEDERWPDQKDAFYIHHLTVDIKEKGLGIIMLKYMEDEARKYKKEAIRLDSAIGNTKLEKYYSDLGYKEKGYCKDGLYNGILREIVLK